MKQRLMSKFASSGLIAGLVVGLSSGRADACGGFFCSQQQPVNQAAERIIFADHGDGTVTAVIQIMYEGPAESFSWLLPISTVPEGDDLKVASDLAFTRLQLATNPTFNLTTTVEGRCGSAFANDNALAGPVSVQRESCEDNPYLVGCEAPEGGANLEASGIVGAFEWSVISVPAGQADPSVPALAWLNANGYDATPESAALIGPYLAEGMYLLALRLTKGADTGSIRPIQLTYAAEAPMIPIKLTAVAANDDMGVMTWTLSSSRAVPFNYNALELNEARVNWFNASSNYDGVVTEAADAAGGQGFVTEFAGPSSSLAEVVWRADEEAAWLSIETRTYFNFQDIFNTVFESYQSWNGFWDAIRRAVVLPEGLSFENFRICPNCYSDDITFSPASLLDAIETDVIEPVRGVQALIDAAAYTTRLYSTLSAAEMLVDPVFKFNPDLPDVDNIHQATRVIECNENVQEFEASWRIDFPQGSTIRGTAQDVGQWPDAVAEQPANFRVLTLSTSGDGVVLEDNESEINGLLSAYNATVPSPGAQSGGLCALSAPPGERPSSSWLSTGLWGVFGLAWLRRRRSSAARPV